MPICVPINTFLVSMIDIRQMRYFVVLAETLHFGHAAERLHLSQPPLSRQIAALEKELGVRLLERHSRQAALTRAGQRFLEDARAVLTSFDQACRNARLADRGELGELLGECDVGEREAGADRTVELNRGGQGLAEEVQLPRAG